MLLQMKCSKVFESLLETSTAKKWLDSNRLSYRPLRSEIIHADIRRNYIRDGQAPLIISDEPGGFYFRPNALLQSSLSIGGASGVLITRSSERLSASKMQQDFLVFAYELTEKEVMTCLHLLNGLSPQEIAEAERVSTNTVRSHLKRVYEKVDVRGQSELIAKLLNGPLGLLRLESKSTVI